MDILILKTNINSKNDFRPVDDFLCSHFSVNECTVDLEDRDKVLRIVGHDLIMDEIISKVSDFGFECSELLD